MNSKKGLFREICLIYRNRLNDPITGWKIFYCLGGDSLFTGSAPFADKLPSHYFRLKGSKSLNFSNYFLENLPVERL